jgi:4-nitrophenyl phosphatase
MIGAMAWILDLDGVVWRGDQPIAGSAEAIGRLRASGEEVGFVTNFSYAPVEAVEAKLAGFGIEARGAVSTSAQAAAGLLEPGERALLVAGPGVRQALEQRGVEVVDDGEADAVVVGWHPEFTYDRMAAAMHAVGHGARLIATNDDATLPTPEGALPGGGAILASIERAAGVTAVVAGKPYAPSVDALWERYGREGTMVGDRPDTDGRFAVALGYRWALVLSGVATSDDVDPPPDLVARTLADLVAADAR